ncbi:TIGR02611 family protein [Gordonia iterans]
MSAREAGRRLRWKIWARKKRYVIRRNPRLDRLYRAAVAVVGTVMILAGMVMVPLPTPGFGWILIFLGLGVLSTEFTWAKWLTGHVRRGYDAVRHWFARQSASERIGMVTALAVVVVTALWLSGSLGTAGGWVGYDSAWLSGPFRR